MSAPTTTSRVPKHLAGVISDEDYLDEKGLAAIEDLIPLVPQDFTIGHCQARAKSVTLTISVGRCCRCGRALTDPESRAQGYGSECARSVA